MAKLILNRLSKRFGTGKPAVDDVSITIRDGGFLALLGPSGCGKTTVLRMIAGFEQPTDGSILLGERVLADAGSMVPPERRNMAMVFQSYALWPHMTVADNAGYPLKVRGISGETYKRKVAHALATVRLEAYADRRPSELSGGQRQRVALARCLVTEPDVVLLDEPLANLDRHLRQEMEETFREFHLTSGATMIYVTHDQAEAMALATDVAVMSEGKLLQMAAPAELYARPEGRLVGGLVGQGAILSLALPESVPRSLDWSLLKPLMMAESSSSPRGDILVRPQDVIQDGNGIPCRVVNILYEGERYSLRLTLPDGQVLRAYSREPAAIGSLLPIVIRSAWRL
ncbi:ABC transporter ATP-binding protein [Agrobacterium rubi]|uniref:ABC transporter ATP-binding protein n=1 Tax=Agrobacterium rubi TaxID=28099 RepID=A0AAE7R347_9HYPH|nr:ABC transporter ATP-binding protein [Agrobacterium rubi]NTE86749.1 ABC transporter ATP-binding protein [Agrobacterium rubi]NTF02683.1 ABC transporter ATP-binding protein [Agrobacterium rubi]NTF36927.1 ABC transporter ATP-binding protein [Agrobacterium rubi]OCJ55472.1 ABC transporter ATP-binding protein [Agrobacterium rubi]QTF99367.1 ABC transporter ATP-binding protein [Agrobacterium rubi]